MIVRKDPTGGMLLLGQTDHSRLAGLFGSHWGNDQFAALEPYESVAETEAFLNGKPVGVTETGAVFYRDVAPGQYTISVHSDGVFPDQFKTVILKPGDVAYARIESIKSWMSCGSGGGRSGGTTEGCEDTFVVVMIDPALAQADMHDLRFIRG